MRHVHPIRALSSSSPSRIRHDIFRPSVGDAAVRGMASSHFKPSDPIKAGDPVIAVDDDKFGVDVSAEAAGILPNHAGWDRRFRLAPLRGGLRRNR